MNETPQTAATRTRMVRKAVVDAGYAARIRSDSMSHREPATWVFPSDRVDDVAAYLTGYLTGLASVRIGDGFLIVTWS